MPRKILPFDDLRSDDRALVRRLRAGEEQAFEAFFDSHFPALYRFLLARLDGDRELARELAQAAISKGVEHLDSYRGEASLFTWLCAIGRYEITGHFRRLERRPPEVELPEDGMVAAGGLASLPFHLDDPEDQALRREVGRLVHVAADNLPTHYRRALLWKYLDGLSVREIGERLELSPKAAESLLTRARVAFRDGFASLTGQEAMP
jgi:RNA polymerase sigma-70 factor (ECF subfamily)